ncbi:MAG: TSUP family transporter [Syntrophorhabdales bacterium]|jgi:hypothetical protein
MPLEYVVVPLAALGAAVLTFLSGFGLGTLLMPVFALFFPVPLAIALTAIIHFLNNFFEMAFLYRYVNVKVALAFGLPAAAGAYGGARLLSLLSRVHPLEVYNLFGVSAEVTAVKLIVGLLILLFAAFEVVPRLRNLSFGRRYVPLGGIVSGFFGGLSGHQGAPRAAFLIRTGLSKESYVATGVAAAILIDLSRLSVYVRHFVLAGPGGHVLLLIVACAAALAGTAIGSRIIGKVTFSIVRILVSVLLVVVGLGLATGLL